MRRIATRLEGTAKAGRINATVYAVQALALVIVAAVMDEWRLAALAIIIAIGHALMSGWTHASAAMNDSEAKRCREVADIRDQIRK